MTYNLRTSVLRMDTAIPLGPNKVVIEFRGLGLKSGHSRAARRARPRPQHDLGAVRSQLARRSARRARSGARDAGRNRQQVGDPRARGEHRPFTTKSACVTSTPSGADAWVARLTTRSESVPRRLPARKRWPTSSDGARWPRRRAAAIRFNSRKRYSQWFKESRSRNWSIVHACLLDEKNFPGFLDLCDPSFHYAITAYSPEIRKEMTWLEHDKAGMKLLFAQPSEAQQRPFAAHAPRDRLHGGEEGEGNERRARVVSALQVFRTSLDGGATELFAVGRFRTMSDRSAQTGRSSPIATCGSNADARDRLPHSLLKLSRQFQPMKIQLNARNRAHQFEANAEEKLLYAACAMRSICRTSAAAAPAAPARRGCLRARSRTSGLTRRAGSFSRGPMSSCCASARPRSDLSVEVASFVHTMEAACLGAAALPRSRSVEARKLTHDVDHPRRRARSPDGLRCRPVRHGEGAAAIAGIAAGRWSTMRARPSDSSSSSSASPAAAFRNGCSRANPSRATTIECSARSAGLRSTRRSPRTCCASPAAAASPGMMSILVAGRARQLLHPVPRRRLLRRAHDGRCVLPRRVD